MARDEFHDVKKVAYSPVVGHRVMLLNVNGACIGQLAFHGCKDAQDMADQVVAALKPSADLGQHYGNDDDKVIRISGKKIK